MIKSRFNKKIILVTGAGTGIGKAAALRLAKEGAQLVLIGRRIKPLQELVKEIETLGGSAIALPCYISNIESLSNTIAQVTERFGHLHGVFANAGVLGEFSPLSGTTVEDFDSLIEINIKGTFLTIKHCLALLEAEGAIVINASWTAQSVMPGAGAYAATKGALVSMMKTLAVEQGHRGIRVNAINPGIILTPMAEAALDRELSRDFAHHTALKRNGIPEDISGTVAWLLSEDAAFVTGLPIPLEG